VVLNGRLDVYGTVRGNATALNGDVVVHRGARVTGNAIAAGGKVVLAGGRVDGKVRMFTSVRDLSRMSNRGVNRVSGSGRHSTTRSVSMAIGWLLIVSVVGFVLMAFGSDKLETVVRTLQQGVFKSLATGLLGQIAIVPGAIAVAVLLAATLIGILLIPLGLVAFMFMVAGITMFGFVAVATMTGAAITGGKNRDETPHGAMLRAFLTGTAVYLGMWLVTAALSGIPLLGAMAQAFASAVTFIAVTAGFGAVLLSYWRGKFKGGVAV